MTVLTWDQVGERFFETGVDRAVLYLPDSGGNYDTGFAWNGMVSVTETPSGAEPTPQYADNIKYLNLYSLEEFGATIEAFTYPDEWAECDGTAVPQPGVTVGQQNRKAFGLSYRTRKGNDIEGPDLGYKLHLVYGATASPSEKAYGTINESPEAITFSWEIYSVPVPVTGYKPTAILTIDSTKVDADALADLEDFLYGTVGTDPSLPSPDAVLAIFAGSLTTATPTAPTYNSTTDIITIPTVTGVEYVIDGAVVPAGAFGPIAANTLVSARPIAGYKFPVPTDDDWLITFA
jgi:hypothetical protein